MKLSIVTTLYNSAPYIAEFYQRISSVVEAITNDYEIIFVNDGSLDNSLDITKNIQFQDSKVVLIDLSRNFGHHQAIVAGLRQAVGDSVFLIDCDLEEQPEWLSVFWNEYNQTDADVIYGVQKERNGSWFNKNLAGYFYKIFNFLSEVKIPENPCTVRLMSQQYVERLLMLKDKNLFLAGNFAWTGFKQHALSVQKIIRKKTSSYGLFKRFGLLLNAISSFSSYPLSLIFFTGIVIAGLSGFIGCVMIVRKILDAQFVQFGWSSIMVSIWFLGGLIILFLGIIGLYLSKMFIEIKERPQYLIKDIYKNE